MEGCAATSKRYVFIDYENVQPQDLAPLDERVNVGAFSAGQRQYLEFHRERVFLEARVVGRGGGR